MSLHQDITDREHVLCQFPSQLKEPRRYLLFPPLNPPWLHQSLVRALEFFAVKSFQFKLSTIFTFIDTCIFEINMQRHQSENCCCIGKFRNLIDEINIPASFPPSKKTKKKQAEANFKCSKCNLGIPEGNVGTQSSNPNLFVEPSPAAQVTWSFLQLS